MSAVLFFALPLAVLAALALLLIGGRARRRIDNEDLQRIEEDAQ